MNNAASHAVMIHINRSNKVEIVQPMDAMDCKILNKVSAALIKFGAASDVRLAKVCKLEMLSVRWALWNLNTVSGAAELHSLPGDQL